MHVLAVIIARAGSKGLPDKCVRPLLGRAVIEYTFDRALAAGLVDAVVLTTDSPAAKRMAFGRGIAVVDRPAELAGDTATIDAAARHAVEAFENQVGRTFDAVALLYGNIPVRAPDLIDRAVAHLRATGADSVRSVAQVSKQHPDWIHRLDGDRMEQFRPNSFYRRQDLEPLYYHDGAVAVVTRQALFAAPRWPGDNQGFLGDDRRAILQQPEDSVDIDGPIDFHLAEAILRAKQQENRAATVRERFHTTPGTQASNWAPEPLGVDSAIPIGNRRIGPNHPPYVIAEAGVNHNGDRAEALRLVDAAADCGADAVKFQHFTAASIATAAAATAAYQSASTAHVSQRAMLESLELTIHDLAVIRDHCRARGVEFLATPFSTECLAQLVELGVPAIKLASTDLNNQPLVRASIATGLPLIVSTGAANADEIAEAVELLQRESALDRTILLHCVSCYPTPLSQANLRAIGELARRFGTLAGFSDHTTSAQIAGPAVAAGACVLEKHFTLNRGAAGPDHALSLEPAELKVYVESARQAHQALGSGDLNAIAAEQEVRRIARKSVVAAADIQPEQVLTAEMLTTKRPGGGLPPSEIDRLIGRIARRPIAADTPLSFEMLR